MKLCRVFCTAVLFPLPWLVACGTPGPVGGAGGGAGDGGTLPGFCQDVPAGLLCVKGQQGQNGETYATLNVGDPLQIAIAPAGCWSSSCTTREVAICSVGGSGPFVAQARFCLGPRLLPVCSPDCGGGGGAFCESATKLTAGEHTVTLGDLSLKFTVPSQIPIFGLCVRSPF